MNTTILRSLSAPASSFARVAWVIVILLLVAAPRAAATERWATLQAIHLLENPADSSQPGSLGELGAYQFREETWRMHTTAPFQLALDRRVSDAVAVKHYDWLRSELVRRGIEATPYRIALAWNGGLKAVLSARPTPAAMDYASRAANLAAEFERLSLADAR
jgi:hypothetical protein